MTAAGIALKAPCDGCGESTMKLAAESIARACGYGRAKLHTTYD